MITCCSGYGESTLSQSDYLRSSIILFCFFSTAYFERHIAQIIVEISKPTAVEIVKDLKVTFPDMLGTIGK